MARGDKADKAKSTERRDRSCEGLPRPAGDTLSELLELLGINIQRLTTISVFLESLGREAEGMPTTGDVFLQ